MRRGLIRALFFRVIAPVQYSMAIADTATAIFYVIC